jgi:nitroreductase
MDALLALRARRSIRRYKPMEVSRDDLATIVDCGRLAATARGVQPWEFVVVTDPSRKAKLAEICEYGKFLAQAAAAIVVLCREGQYYLEDGCAAAENMLVAATALGLGTCWVAGDKKPYAADICNIVGAPEGLRLVSLIPMGYPAENPEKPKRPLADLLHWEKY